LFRSLIFLPPPAFIFRFLAMPPLFFIMLTLLLFDDAAVDFAILLISPCR